MHPESKYIRQCFVWPEQVLICAFLCQLEEVIIGSLTERPACGDALTQVARVKDPSAPATIVDAGQLCAGMQEEFALEFTRLNCMNAQKRSSALQRKYTFVHAEASRQLQAARLLMTSQSSCLRLADALGTACTGAANAMDVMEDAMEIATAIANLTGPVAESLQDIFKHISRFNDTCQGDSGGPLFVKGDPVQFASNQMLSRSYMTAFLVRQ